MNDLLSSLGVNAEVQAFFRTEELLFTYGEHYEQFGKDYHRVPTTRYLWLAGDLPAKELVITTSAMDAIAYLHFNSHRHTGLRNLAFVAVGNLPHDAQLKWIITQIPKSRKILAFGNDLLGRLADIRVAAGLHGKSATFNFESDGLVVTCNRMQYRFQPECLSLHAFQQAAALRLACRTAKPRTCVTYLQQLLDGKSC